MSLFVAARANCSCQAEESTWHPAGRLCYSALLLHSANLKLSVLLPYVMAQHVCQKRCAKLGLLTDNITAADQSPYTSWLVWPSGRPLKLVALQQLCYSDCRTGCWIGYQLLCEAILHVSCSCRRKRHTHYLANKTNQWSCLTECICT